MWQRTKVIRRIIFYVLVLGYAIIHPIMRQHDLLTDSVFAAMALYAICQLIEDISSLRRSSQ